MEGQKADGLSRPNPPPDAGVRGDVPKAGAPVPPREHNTIVRVSLFTLAVLLSTAAVAYLGRILEPLVFAALLFFIIESAAEWVSRFGTPKWVAYCVLLLAAVVIFVGVAQLTLSNLATLRKRQEEYLTRMSALADHVNPGLGESVRESLAAGVGQVRDQAPWTLYSATEFGLMMFFYLLFFVLSAHNLPGRVRRAFPERADGVLSVTDRVSTQMQRYVRVKTVVGLGLGGTTAVVMGLFGIEYWPLWALLFFFLNYITYIGSIAALVPPILLAYVDRSGFQATVVAALLIAARVFWIDFVEIRLSGRELNIDSVLLLLALAFWGSFWGVAGLVLAVPMLTCLKVILESIDDTRPWAILMSET